MFFEARLYKSVFSSLSIDFSQWNFPSDKESNNYLNDHFRIELNILLNISYWFCCGKMFQQYCGLAFHVLFHIFILVFLESLTNINFEGPINWRRIKHVGYALCLYNQLECQSAVFSDKSIFLTTFCSNNFFLIQDTLFL